MYLLNIFDGGLAGAKSIVTSCPLICLLCGHICCPSNYWWPASVPSDVRASRKQVLAVPNIHMELDLTGILDVLLPHFKMLL